MVTLLTSYESILIIPDTSSNNEIKALMYFYGKTLKKLGASKIFIRYCGKRRFAYPIEKDLVGYYIQFKFKLHSYNLPYYSQLIKLDPKICRSFILKS